MSERSITTFLEMRTRWLGLMLVEHGCESVNAFSMFDWDEEANDAADDLRMLLASAPASPAALELALYAGWLRASVAVYDEFLRAQSRQIL